MNAANIVNKGSAKADNSHAVACNLHMYCFEQDIRLQAEWRPRKEDKFADFLSKLHDSDDWKLHPRLFQGLDRLWVPFDIDLFASHTNHQVPRYYSRFFTPDTAGVDAFRFSWGRACWANPPFGLIRQVLQHAQACGARLGLIIPYWPTRDWWSLLTDDGTTFRQAVRAVRWLGQATDLFLPGSTGNELPKGAAAWPVLALLMDFGAPGTERLRIPADPLAPRPQTWRPGQRRC
ncbi:hypothetical protein GPECTOR_257g649 [Gonium pectorale]|uniref:PCIF1 WW domain-containing protein n=1 Tax=Gonium pectorale TaxID=33097 RepID=A0A150FXE3_GONPE|nr:hypothetical protein GPECTOR_257g649 [Gonium pectorale]|eukprot:KXZ41865.1 hypothetical protein GPECTOR_257g649 [Gonium pectorale]